MASFSDRAARRIINAVKAFESQPDDATGSPIKTRSGRNCFFPVIVVQNGGTDGDGSVLASWTYDVYLLDGTTKINGDTPLLPQTGLSRWFPVMVTPGDAGMAYYAATGAVKLWMVNDTPDYINCPVVAETGG